MKVSSSLKQLIFVSTTHTHTHKPTCTHISLYPCCALCTHMQGNNLYIQPILTYRPIYIITYTDCNESNAGADASVEVPKLHNIKLLITSFYTNIDYNFIIIMMNIFNFACMQNPESQGNSKSG